MSLLGLFNVQHTSNLESRRKIIRKLMEDVSSVISPVCRKSRWYFNGDVLEQVAW